MTREHFERLCFGDYVEPKTQRSWVEVPGKPWAVRLQRQAREELQKLYPRRRTFVVFDEVAEYTDALGEMLKDSIVYGSSSLVFTQAEWRYLMRDPWLRAQVRP